MQPIIILSHLRAQDHKEKKPVARFASFTVPFGFPLSDKDRSFPHLRNLGVKLTGPEYKKRGEGIKILEDHKQEP